MPYTFKCGLCKNEKDITLRSKIILWTLNDLHSDTWCSNCVNKVIQICKLSHLDKEHKQLILNQWGVKLEDDTNRSY